MIEDLLVEESARGLAEVNAGDSLAGSSSTLGGRTRGAKGNILKSKALIYAYSH